MEIVDEDEGGIRPSKRNMFTLLLQAPGFNLSEKNRPRLFVPNLGDFHHKRVETFSSTLRYVNHVRMNLLPEPSSPIKEWR